ncbi:MAG: hypothetical protein ACD_81C00184G0003 [uncultured bacterium]|uniref:Chromosome segregation DNA-binding protein n=2 Tax=Candidatus Wolfeibacteriota TaxID=1752735 RepID=A0A0G1H5A1_9BACT|nr:MAG: hypothetical protein ACD_81C00184G0003 [uncultured bacterium]KKR12203.1 MAG: Chromosome segregation DNA-binding protein [Candidatus Wolfebacteria bacterium GW2011_GWC2_39_22]KKT42576.1 MAG: Chromosome segregation DNA-binding protein [Candidatus Wolfebacteria bacterium GW2011_GWE2_44_13]HBI25181.1 hypothetical protein [Candidatus Wolfebacteria bacterium]
MSKHKNKQIEVPWAVITDGIIKAEVGTTVRIPLKLIVPNPDQPRKFFDPSELEALALSCKERGDVEKPIDVVLRDNGRNVLIVDGENRYRSVQLGKLKGVSCYIRPPMNDNDVYLSSAIANIRRKDFSIIEIALALHELQQRFKLNQTEAGERLGMKPHQTLYYLRFLNLIEEVQILLMHGKLGAGVALQLAKFSQEHQKLLLQKIKEAVRANGSKPIHPNKIARILRGVAEKHNIDARQGSRGRAPVSHAQLVLRNVVTTGKKFAEALVELRAISQTELGKITTPHPIDVQQDLLNLQKSLTEALSQLDSLA